MVKILLCVLWLATLAGWLIFATLAGNARRRRLFMRLIEETRIAEEDECE